jgi:hypothetical protein
MLAVFPKEPGGRVQGTGFWGQGTITKAHAPFVGATLSRAQIAGREKS